MCLSELEDKLQSILSDPDAMGQIMGIARSLTGGTNGQDAPDPPASNAPADSAPDPLALLSQLDPRLVQLGMRLISEYQSGDDRKAALLAALQPFVRQERYARVDQAVHIARLAHIIRLAVDALREEGDDHV